MSFYAEIARSRVRQMAADLAFLVWVVAWILAGAWVFRLLRRLAGLGEAVEQAGARFAGIVDVIGRLAADVPLVGRALAPPFDSIVSAGRVLESAGVNYQGFVQAAAVWLGILLALIPVLLMAYAYVPGRIRWVRESAAARRLRPEAAGRSLFALRAVLGRPLHQLLEVSDDPAGDFLAGRYEVLAELELRALGLHPAAPGGQG